MDANTERQLRNRLLALADQTHKEASYNPTAFKRMFTEGNPVAAIKALLANENHVASGFTKLFLKGKLDLTVEAQILSDALWWPHFTDEDRAVARRRLKKVNYTANEPAIAEGRRPPTDADVAAAPQRASLQALTRDAVIQAIREFDDLGREVFLETYGYGEADGYWLLYDQGRYDRYDSEAIVGVAFKYIAGIERSLRANEFLGGRTTVLPALQRLGFDVEVDPNVAPRVRRPALLDPEAAEEQPFDPTNQEDAREKVLREIRARRGQQKFREALVEAYAGRCAITDCSVLDVLEAAHITPYLGPETNHVTNGLLLRADLHTLFDTLLLAVDPDTMKVLVAPTIEDPAYRDLHGKPLRATLTKATAPSERALKQHRAECRW
ncbi:HNH endonuclease [Falsiroseomonas sp. HW251]|uniref:HNH endonuclease n=1 Tax=Falsiroseomonas sp. HW251 TaxID=3390998 RepID=UPI003D312AF4